MSIIDKKKKVFGKIAAAKTLTSGLPRLKLTSSLESINNKGNSISFLTDLIKSLIGYEALVSSVVDILMYSFDKIEIAVKTNLKQELKSIVSCGINPQLPNWVKSTGDGIIINVKKIDFFDILRIDPNSVAGNLIYSDITNPLTSSSDFNTFLYGVIQDDGNTHTWNPNGIQLFDITFNSVGVGSTPNNSLTIKANVGYDNKTLTELNNNFIDSLTLFKTENILNQIMDIIYGAVSTKSNKSVKQLEMEEKLNNVIDKMVNNVNKDIPDDGFFTFTNPEINEQQTNALNRKVGISFVNTNKKVTSTIPTSNLTDFNQEFNSVTSTQEKTEVLKSNLIKMADSTADKIKNRVDGVSVKLNFIQQIVNNLIKAIINIILSPKVIFIFLLNYKIIYGQLSEFTNPIDFIKQNKKLMNAMMKKISEEIIKNLIAIALKEINALVVEAGYKLVKEKATLKLAQLQSLIGVPPLVVKKLLNNL
jgi:flagellar hook-basal body complex protein FliE